MSDAYFVFRNGSSLHQNLKRCIKFIRSELGWKGGTKHIKLNSSTDVLMDEALKLKADLIQECMDVHGANEYVDLVQLNHIDCDTDSVTVKHYYYPSENWDNLNMMELMGLAKYGYYLRMFHEKPHCALSCENPSYYARAKLIDSEFKA